MLVPGNDGCTVPQSLRFRPPIPAHHLRIVILANHLNGKDTHVRGVKIFGAGAPAASQPGAAALDEVDPAAEENDEQGPFGKSGGKKLLMLGHDGLSGFTSRAFKMHESIR